MRVTTVLTAVAFASLVGLVLLALVRYLGTRRRTRRLMGLPAPGKVYFWTPEAYGRAARASRPLTLGEMRHFSARTRATGTPPLGVPYIHESDCYPVLPMSLRTPPPARTTTPLREEEPIHA